MPSHFVTEYGANYVHPSPNMPGYMPAWYSSRTAPAQSYPPAVKVIERTIGQGNLMDDWLNRTKSKHFGVIQSDYPDPSPFSEKPRPVNHLKLPNIEIPEDVYRKKYEELLAKLKKKKMIMKDLPGGGKGMWRHIRESYGAGPSLLSWVDGPPIKDGGKSALPKQGERVCGGKGPNRHIIDSYGAGSSVITWVNGPPYLDKSDRSARFSTCIPLPTLYQEDFGPYSLIGGQRIRKPVKGLRDDIF